MWEGGCMPVHAEMDGCFYLLYGHLHLPVAMRCMPACLVCNHCLDDLCLVSAPVSASIG